MVFRVELAKGAEADLDELYLWVVERAPHQGAAWFNGLQQAILSLDRRPERCPLAPESVDPERPVRVLHYGRARNIYRILFATTTGGDRGPPDPGDGRRRACSSSDRQGR